MEVWLPLTRPLLGAEPANQACALAGNPTCDPLVCRLALSLLSHSRDLLSFVAVGCDSCILGCSALTLCSTKGLTCSALLPGMILLDRQFEKQRVIFLKRFYLFISRQRRREGERDGENHQYVVASRTLPTGDLACHPDMCPGWELNL